MAVTIKDVARHAGVSISTVSRVLNKNYPVKDEIKERVEKSVLECGYKPNALAGGLRSKNSKIIAVAIPGVANTFYMEIVRGIQKVSYERDCTLVIVDTGEDEEKERKILENLLGWQLNGLIIAPASPTPDVLEKMENSGVSVVIVDRDIDSFINTDRVVWENYETSRKITRYLIEHGHKNIGLICAQNRFPVGFDRVNGYLDELKSHGITPRGEYYDNTNYNIDEAYETVKKMMTGDEPPTAYIGISYFGTKAVMKAARDLGLKIPDDISLVSFSKFDLNDYYLPRITNVDEDLCEMGERAAEILFERLESNNIEDDVKKLILSAEITVGDSVKEL